MEVWTDDRLQEQFYAGSPTLDALEKTDRYNVGKIAVTPIETHRTGGYTVVPRSGSSNLNPASNVGVNRAEWDYTHHHVLVKIEGSAIDQTDSETLSAANVVESETTSAIDEARKQVTRQVFSDGSALIVACDTTTTSTTVHLDPDKGSGILGKGWLHPGLTVDIGTTSDEDSIVGDASIVSVDFDPTDPTITIDSAVSTSSSDFVSIANARQGATSFEATGLDQIVSQSAVLGNIDPADEPLWAGADADSSTTVLTLPAIYTKQRKVQERTGNSPDFVVSSFRQRQNFYTLLQGQIRFPGDSVSTGNVEGATFAGMKFFADLDCPDEKTYFLTKSKLFVLEKGKPYWQNQVAGGKPLQWLQGTTAFGGLLTFRFQLATKNRNAHAAFLTLTTDVTPS